jgi:ABC-type glycerol-3-phosphate transport system substrate-binding protein
MLLSKKRQICFRGVTLIGVGLMFIGCLFISGNSAAASSRQASGAVTLNVWEMDFGPGYTETINQDLAQWKTLHPNIKINLVVKSYTVIETSGKLALSGPGSPDIMVLVEGWQDVQEAAAGLLVNLNKYAKQYGWYHELSASVLAVNSNTSNGKYFGKGNLYSVSDSGTENGYFYNKTVLDHLGLTVPKTLAEMTNDMAVAKAHGLIPMEQAALEHTWDVFMVSDMPTSAITNWVYGNGNVTVDNPSEIAGAQTLLNWVKDGYFQPGFISASEGNSTAPIDAFLAGKSLFYGTGGPTVYGEVAAAHQENNVGFFLQPPAKVGGALATPGGGNNPWAISARSTHQAQAAEFINFLLSKPAQERVQPVSGYLPTDLQLGINHGVPNTLLDNTLSSAYASVAKSGQVIWPDISSTNAYNLFTATVTELVSGKLSPQDMLKQIQQGNAQFISTLGR